MVRMQEIAELRGVLEADNNLLLMGRVSVL